MAPLPLAVAPLDERVAFAAGALRAATRGLGLSLGDRAALALAARRGAVALTADKAWRDAGRLVGVPVELLRQPRASVSGPRAAPGLTGPSCRRPRAAARR